VKVWKFEIVDPEAPVAMPYGAVILSVGVQHERVCVWALVAENEPMVARRFVVARTGTPIPGHGQFIGTVLLHGGDLVFHVWEGFDA
jgi:hypothetical protein